ncbi:N utilization substance protein B [Cryobacterium mesophilum]|uniref:Transcription antitermination protein NusB n=1 Tax=Terrimesophilobacter mesophilus TaxID=433647 RepID=A0A4R8V904_9MICO|nr:transcription antitermination factor NusB [Terrimesophilobacter mesophilus]MBB5631876.1 N utilization substance protein B [Terrimesophilobacter mesophilus]TFB78786.1 transcription antitermination factor NusB [Terrimesophilobacter mesophilus]
MSARTKARKRALDLLYGADLRSTTIADAIASESERAQAEPRRSSSWEYAREISVGVDEHRAEIDELIETYALGWPIHRMPTIDRAIVRMGIWELVFNPEVPDGVAIAEAVELARTYSTEDSAGFVNGVLGRIAEAQS